MNIKSVSPAVEQMVLQKLGMFCSERLSVDLYYLMEAVNILIHDVGDKFMKQTYDEQKKDWIKTKENLKKLNKLILNTKTFYDPIVDKKFEKKDVNESKTQSMFRRQFIKNSSKINLLQEDLYEVFMTLVYSTSLQRRTIPNEAFKILEHQSFKKITTTDRTSPSPSPNPISENH